MARGRFLVFLTLWLITVASSLWLGVWQLQRLEWKTRLLAHIDAAYQGQPHSLRSDQLFPALPDRAAFLRGTVTGMADDAGSFLVGPRIYNGQVGWHWYVPFTLADGQMIWVNRGFVVHDFVPPARPLTRETITGVLRKPDLIGAIHQSGKDGGSFKAMWQQEHIAHQGMLSSFVLYAETATAKHVVPVGVRPILRNEHRNYAIFWFTMATIALGFGVLQIRRRSTHQQI